MKIDIETLKDTFQIGYNAYLDSKIEANEVEDLYHNRQYSSDQLNTLENRGQPKETFNVVKLFARQLVGYYSTVINTVKVNPVQYNDIDTASILNDVTNHVFNTNSFESEGDSIKLDGFLSGLMCSYQNVVYNGKTDQYGRKLYDITIEHVPSSEIVLDPMSTRDDYKDARFIHRFKWLDEETVERTFGKAKEEKLEAYTNFLNTDESEFEFKYGDRFQGIYKQHDNYLIVHSVITDDSGDTWSIYWSGEFILDKKKITYKEVKFPYRVVKLTNSNKVEHYGVFREVVESQKAINQAIIQIQQMANSNKAMVQTGAVKDLAKFTAAFNRVNSIIEVTNLLGIKIENLSGDIQQQYLIVDKAFDRIQRILGINDSFLGMAYASDSGRKVKLQQNASMVALRYITKKLELYYKMVGWDVVNLVKQYYTANQVLRIADETVGQRWVELNKPIMLPDANGNPIVTYDEDIDPASGEPNKDDNGNIIMVPLNDSRTDISFTEVDIEITTNAYNDEDEKNQLMLETMLSGNIGNALMTVNPAGYMKAASLSVKSMKSKHSQDIAGILEQTAQMLSPQPEMQNQLGMSNPSSQQPSSQQLKLPQNTNEGR
jgi:hypothetical protein